MSFFILKCSKIISVWGSICFRPRWKSLNYSAPLPAVSILDREWAVQAQLSIYLVYTTQLKPLWKSGTVLSGHLYGPSRTCFWKMAIFPHLNKQYFEMYQNALVFSWGFIRDPVGGFTTLPCKDTWNLVLVHLRKIPRSAGRKFRFSLQLYSKMHCSSKSWILSTFCWGGAHLATSDQTPSSEGTANLIASALVSSQAGLCQRRVLFGISVQNQCLALQEDSITHSPNRGCYILQTTVFQHSPNFLKHLHWTSSLARIQDSKLLSLLLSHYNENSPLICHPWEDSSWCSFACWFDLLVHILCVPHTQHCIAPEASRGFSRPNALPFGIP